MQYPSIKEASKYANELVPTKDSIYSNGGALYSGFKTMALKKEFSIPDADYSKSGILQQIKMVWYATSNTLWLYNYDTNTTESIPNFSSDVQQVFCFTPIFGIFHPRIKLCLLVITESNILLYAIDNGAIVNTDFSCGLYFPVSSVAINNGRIFIGCKDGNAYQVVYNSIDIIGYKYMNLYKPYSIVSSICSIFKRKKRGILAISASENYLVVLDNINITVYSISNGMSKDYMIPCMEEYCMVQIIEDSPLLFYCIQKSGKRDFFTKEKILSRDFPIGDFASENSEGSQAVLKSNIIIRSDKDRLLSIRLGSSSSVLLISFNTDQLRNFSRLRPVENFETLMIHSYIKAVDVYNESLVILTDTKISTYEILDSRRYLRSCRSQEVWAMYKNYGDIEFMVRYYELLAANEDVSRMEGICRNDNIKNYAFFIFIYNLIKPVFSVDLAQLLENKGNGELLQILDSIISRLKHVRNKIPMHFDEAKMFIDEFIQTYNYVSLLYGYSISFKETFESILTKDGDFKSSSLKTLLATVSLSQSIEPLLKAMKNSCPLYLPLDQVNLQRGFEFLEKGNGSYLKQSLECFSETRFDKRVVKHYNTIGYYYGSVVMIRDKFEFSYEEATSLLEDSVKCKKSVDAGLASSNEAFLYPFFEVLLKLEKYLPCKCCENSDPTIDLIKIEHPVFLIFLKDKGTSCEKAYKLHWKYLLYRGKRMEAVEALVNICNQANIDFQEKITLLETALTIYLSIDYKLHDEKANLLSRIKQMLKLSKIQMELIERDSSLKTNQLLSADTLFNDYCVEYPDLGIKILDAIGYNNKQVLKRLYSQYFEDKSLLQALVFLKEISNKNLNLVFDILIEKLEDTHDFCERLQDAGFNQQDIIAHVNNALQGSVHPKTKNILLRSLEKFIGNDKYAESKKYCETAFGLTL